MQSSVQSEIEKLSEIIKKGELVFIGNQKLVSTSMVGLNLCSKYFRMYSNKLNECYLELFNLNKNWNKNFVESISPLDLFLVSETSKSNDTLRTASEQLENYYLKNIKSLQYEYINIFKPESKKGLKLLKKLTVDLSILKKKRSASLTAYEKFEKEIEERERKSMTKEKVGNLINLSIKTKSKLESNIVKCKKKLNPYLTSYHETLNLINFGLSDFYKVIEYTSGFYIKMKKSELSRVVELKRMFTESSEHSVKIVNEIETTLKENQENEIPDVTNLFRESDILINKEFGEYDLPISTQELNNLNDSRAVANHNKTYKTKNSFSSFSVEDVEQDLDEKFANATIAITKGSKLAEMLNSTTMNSVILKKEERKFIEEGFCFRGAEKKGPLEHSNINRPLIRRNKRR